MSKTIMDIFATMEYGPVLEAPSQARSWLQGQQSFQLFIEGQWRTPISGQYGEDRDAATGDVLASVAVAGAEDAAQAVAAAQSAFAQWSTTAGHTRARYLYALSRHMQQHAAVLAQLETLDRGNMLYASQDDLSQVARVLSYYAGQAQLAAHEFADVRPLGVVALCISAALPLSQLVQQLAAALALGNTVVLKPAQAEPLVALKLAEIVHEVGLPAGVVNVVTGEDETVSHALATHADVAAVYFVGSRLAGRSLHQQLAGTGKRLVVSETERVPFIVLEDADLDSAVEGVVEAVAANQGAVQKVTHLLVQENVAGALAGKLQTRFEKLRVGQPFDRTVDLSNALPADATAALTDLLAQATKEGLQSWQPTWAAQDSGCPPTLISDVAPASQLMSRLVAGPVVLLTTFRTLAEALSLLATIGDGQTVSLWSENVNVVANAAASLKVRTAWLNSVHLSESDVALAGERAKASLYAYSRLAWQSVDAPAIANDTLHPQPVAPQATVEAEAELVAGTADALLSLTHAAGFFIGGKQTSAGVPLTITGAGDRVLGYISAGSLADLRSAVAAAQKVGNWSQRSAQERAQVLYALAEHLSVVKDACAQRIVDQSGRDLADAIGEVQLSISRLFSYAAWSDTFTGSTHTLPDRTLVLETIEPLGVIGVVAPDVYPLLGLISLIAPAVATGNTVVAVPSSLAPLSAIDLYTVLERAGLPAGVINIVTGESAALSKGLAGMRGVAALWDFSAASDTRALEEAALPDQKLLWLRSGLAVAWDDHAQGEGYAFLRAATQTKHILLPYGV
jgi:NAD-dependent aldehyde dehydrogenases